MVKVPTVNTHSCIPYFRLIYFSFSPTNENYKKSKIIETIFFFINNIEKIVWSVLKSILIHLNKNVLKKRFWGFIYPELKKKKSKYNLLFKHL